MPTVLVLDYGMAHQAPSLRRCASSPPPEGAAWAWGGPAPRRLRS